MDSLDRIHVDPCRRCRGLFFRGDMRPVREVKAYGRKPSGRERGYYCRECAFHLDGETQLTLDIP